MLKKLLFFFSLVILSGSLYAVDVKPGFVAQVYREGMDPVAMTIAPDGRMFIVEQYGAVRIIENDILLAAPLVRLFVDNNLERGLLGIALDPHFSHNGYVYIYYTVRDANHNRVSRFKAIGNIASPESEEIILELDSLSSGIHNGGSMLFGDDGKLYIATGDGGNANTSQSFNSLLGKILRINPDGSIPEDNPYFNLLKDQYRAIWAYGLRNPFSMSYDSDNEMLLANEVGDGRWEEINEIVAGKNYGWPLIEGPRRQNDPLLPDYKDPLFVYDHSQNRCAIVGAAFYKPETTSFPQIYQNKFLYMDFCSGHLVVFDPEEAKPIDTLASGLDWAVGVNVDKTGNIYVLQRGMNTRVSIWKISYSGSGEPVVSRNPSNVVVPVNEKAKFQVSVTGAMPLTYSWTINNIEVLDNDTSVLKLNNVQLDMDSSVVICTISNPEGAVSTTPAYLLVTSGSRPVAQITTSHDEKNYKGGDNLAFTGFAIDSEDVELEASQLTWKIDFHHNDHTHPAMASTSGIKEGYISIPKIGEYSTNVWFRIHLTVIDNKGLSNSIYKDIYPEIVAITLNTLPENWAVALDGKIVSAPHTFESVEGMTRVIEAIESFPNQSNDTLYRFSRWDNNLSSITRSFDASSEISTYTAYYTPEINVDSVVTSIKKKTQIKDKSLVLPNPFDSNIKIILDGHSDECRLKMYDAQGKLIKKQKYMIKQDDSVIEMLTHELNSGVYYLHIQSSKRMEVIRILKMN